MILSDKTIRKLLDQKELFIDPLDDDQIIAEDGKYQGQKNATGSRVYFDVENKGSK